MCVEVNALANRCGLEHRAKHLIFNHPALTRSPVSDVRLTPMQIINVEQEHLLPGKVPSWTPQGIKRQWLTRLAYLSRSPYEVIDGLVTNCRV